MEQAELCCKMWAIWHSNSRELRYPRYWSTFDCGNGKNFAIFSTIRFERSSKSHMDNLFVRGHFLQISLLRHISKPISILLNSFYSASMGKDTWTRANGLTYICAYVENKRFNGIARLLLLTYFIFNFQIFLFTEFAI